VFVLPIPSLLEMASARDVIVMESGVLILKDASIAIKKPKSLILQLKLVIATANILTEISETNARNATVLEYGITIKKSVSVQVTSFGQTKLKLVNAPYLAKLTKTETALTALYLKYGIPS